MNKFILPLRFGIAISGSLIGYFLLLSLFGLHTNPFFSLFNAVITGFGIFEAIRFRRLEHGPNYTYSTGFTCGLVSGFVATIIFSIFMAVYATEVNPNFINNLLTSWDNHFEVTVGTFIFVVALMGFATAVVTTLTVMQLFKNPKK
ncbi:DUF4199 domain-containing protein [Flavobacteriaceae bacterium 14752]|uniref:DUF4199 domain-containing protein n=1 Tax=Mesohalobacter salilacus TaxID=2491711 RepID=UPI000F6323A7|nr:DUF4199 domain-containing protein [Flavobacteriaceae bacterium 14752]